MTLHELRQSIREKRSALTEREKHAASDACARELLQHNAYKTASKIAAYIAVNGEIDPADIIKHGLESEKQVYLPVLDPVEHNHLLFVRYEEGDTMIPNRYGIPEPENRKGRMILAHELDVVLMPLVAFDSQGNRVGMGAGYYDRTFAFTREKPTLPKPTLIGLAHAFQEVDKLEPEAWDVPVDFVVTS